MAVFTGYAQSKIPVKCLGCAWGEMSSFGSDWYINPFSQISPPLSDIGSLLFQGGKLLSPMLF